MSIALLLPISAAKPISASSFLIRRAGEGLIIRDFRREDLDDVIECTKESFAEEFAVTGFDQDVWRKMVRRRFGVFGTVLFGFFKLFDREPIKFFVADADGRVIGTTMVTALRNNGLIETVMVHPDFRRRGVATELMRTAINYARKRKFAKAILQVSSKNPAARSLYEKLGFRKFDDTIYLTVNLDSLPSLEGTRAILVRDFRKSDTDSVYELIRSSIDLNSLRVYGFQKNDLKSSLWNRVAGVSALKQIVAVKDGKIVGYASLSCRSPKQAGRMSRIVVSPDMTSEGIEVELLRVGVNFVKSSGARTVLATVPLTSRELVDKLETIGFKERLIFEGMALDATSSQSTRSV